MHCVHLTVRDLLYHMLLVNKKTRVLRAAADTALRHLHHTLQFQHHLVLKVASSSVFIIVLGVSWRYVTRHSDPEQHIRTAGPVVAYCCSAAVRGFEALLCQPSAAQAPFEDVYGCLAPGAWSIPSSAHPLHQQQPGKALEDTCCDVPSQQGPHRPLLLHLWVSDRSLCAFFSRATP
jgi:hypothetical protein